jgi:glycosyltransferase involved in cell wall biosynthesis
MLKVSVIVPNYNHAPYLEQRIQSILDQSFRDFEIIILDDASTDNSVEVIAKFSDPRITQVIFNKNNSGSTFKQWEKGLSLAQGKYIWIAESDDISSTEFLETTLQIMEEAPQAQISFCASTWINEKGQKIHEPDFESNSQIWTGNSLLQNEFLLGNLIYNASSAVFKKEKLSQVDFSLLAEYKYAGDWFFWMQLSKNSIVKRTGKRLNFFRRHHNNVSFKADKSGLQFKEGLKVIKYIFESENVSFIKKRVTFAKWAKKFLLSKVDNTSQLVSELPLEMRVYVRILKRFF